jgi:hypothetical protein
MLPAAALWLLLSLLLILLWERAPPRSAVRRTG